MLVLLLLIIAAWIFINTNGGQNWIARQVTKRFSKELKTKITIKHVSFSLFNKMNLEGVMVEDQRQDTLLYAGTVQVRITDWFFMKDKAELKYIGLSNARVKLYRTDSVWNHQFLLDYFSSGGSKGEKKGGIEFNLKKAELKNIWFTKQDAWMGEDMSLQLKALDLDADNINFAAKTADANTLLINEPVFTIHKYQRKKPYSTNSTPEIIAKPGPDTALIWNRGGWVVNVDKIKLVNATFINDKDNGQPVKPYFDGQHLLFSSINGELNDVKWIRDSITSTTTLSAKERSGFEVQELKTRMVFHPQFMDFKELFIRTNKSVIRNHFAMRYNSMADMGAFLSKVHLEGNFTDAEIDSDDLGYFAPKLREWNKKITIKGRARGTVDELKAEQLIVKAGNNTLLNGDISLSGLPDINETFIDFKANEFKTTYADAVTIVPQLRRIQNPRLSKIQYLHFTGSFTGFIRDFVTFGTIRTNLGTVTSDLNMKLPKGKEPVYSGNLSSDHFRLGDFLDNTSIGSISFDASVKGSSLNWNKLNAAVDGNIREIFYNNYTYKNITAKGRLNQQQFDGDASINDPNAEASLSGVVDLRNKKNPVFKLHADVGNANLQALKLTEEPLAFNGKFNLDFAGNDIDRFLGTARVSEATLLRDGKRLSFDSLTLASMYEGNNRVLAASSNEFEGTISGDYSIKELPAAVALFLNRYYPAYIKAPLRQPRNQHFDFDITTREVDAYVKLINKDLSGFDNSHFKGHLNLAENSLNAEADIPQFRFKNNLFSGVSLKATGDLDKLSLKGDIYNTQVGDSIQLPQTTLSVEAANNISKIEINTSANKGFNDARLAAQVETFADGVNIRFDPSTFVMNGKKWTIEKDGELSFRSNSVASGELELTEGNQRIKLTTEASGVGSWNELKIKTTNLLIGDLAPYFLKGFKLEGIVDADITVEDPLKRFDVQADIKGREMRFNGDSIGVVEGTMGYSNKTGLLTTAINNTDLAHKLGVNLSLHLRDREKMKDNRISIMVDDYFAAYLKQFIGTLFTDVTGYVTGKLDILGFGDNMKYVGKVKTKDAGMKVIFTQCYYKIEDDEIELKEDQIDFGSLVAVDTVTKNPIYVRGRIDHQSFRDMFFDIFVTTQKPGTRDEANNKPILMLNTKLKDNSSFYGEARGTGWMSLYGPQSDMQMEINGAASEEDSSYITIPSANSKESGMASFMVEKKYGREMTDSSRKTAATNITYNATIKANNKVNVRVVLDELTGDIIKGNGNGTLTVRSGTSEKLDMRGRFEIEKGDYLFTFQSFVKKPFELTGSNNSISWNGDPYDANINIDAKYVADNVSLAPLADAINPNLAGKTDDINVIASLKGQLFKPEISFKIEFTDQQLRNDPSINLRMQQALTQNANEMNKQVTYLIVFTRFAPFNEGQSSGATPFSDLGFNTLSGIFSGVINQKINDILSKLIKDPKLRVNVNSSFYNRNPLDFSNRNKLTINGLVSASLGYSFFNDRFILTVAGNTDIPISALSTSKVQFLPDVTAEWLINKRGNLRGVVFYKQNFDLLNSAASGNSKVSRTGASLSYRKDGNTLWEAIFGSKKKKKEQPPVTDTVINSSPAILPSDSNKPETKKQPVPPAPGDNTPAGNFLVEKKKEE